MWVPPRPALALIAALASISSASAAPAPGAHHGALPASQPQAPGASLQLPLGHGPLRVSQPMQPLRPISAPQRKVEQPPSALPGFNPLKRRHMAMPVLPGEDGSALAF